MPKANPSSKFPLPSRDVSKLLSRFVLTKLRKQPLSSRFSQTYWKQLRIKSPNAADFIRSAAYEFAPDDPEKRERAVAMMLGVVTLFAEDDTVQNEATRWNQFFADKTTTADDQVGDEVAQPEA